MKKVELLAPAGNLEKLKIAILYGADAVYVGGKAYGLRAAAGNFTTDDLKAGLEFARLHQAKVYVTVNIFAHNEDLAGLVDYLRELETLGVDGVIVADPGVWMIARDSKVKLNFHLSTQANTTNWAGARFWEEQGFKRIILARELSLDEIREIRRHVKAQLEIFVHGAMCVSYSGRCLLSNYMAGRDANRGECAQPCRWNYALVEEKRPGRYYPLEEDERGSYIFNSQDLCLLPHLPELINAGIDCFKIEGRMKSVHYVATVVGAYRKALDAYFRDPHKYVLNPAWWEEITKVSHRDYTTGFLFAKPGAAAHNYDSFSYRRSYDFVGLVRDYDASTGWATVEQRGNFKTGDILEFTGPGTPLFTQEVDRMTDEDGNATETAPHPRQIIRIPVAQPVKPWESGGRNDEEK